MGEENRGSSGGNTMLLVIGIVAVVLMVPCCGLVALFGTGFFMARTAVREAQTEMIKAQEEAFERASQENAEMEKLREDIKGDIEPIKLPEPAIAPEPPAIPDAPSNAEEK